ncbi:MAG: SCO family protein [Bacteroidales bacterium]
MKKLVFLLLVLLPATRTPGQNFIKESNLTKEIDIGIIEHLGDTIPLDLTFIDEKEDTVKLRDLINKPTILSFVYFDCPNLCSPLMNGVSEAIAHLDMQLGTDYQVITISFNTSDTPEKAREKKQNFVTRISKEHQKDWIYLTGTQENISKITDAVGYKYKAQGLDFAHPSAIMIVSPSGKITRYLYGLTYLPFDVKMAIIESQKGIARPTINKIMELCFAYNPASKTYTLQVTRIVGSVILLIALIVLTYLIVKGRKKNK